MDQFLTKRPPRADSFKRWLDGKEPRRRLVWRTAHKGLNGCRDFAGTRWRWLDFSYEIGGLCADRSKIQNIYASSGGSANDLIVEKTQRDPGKTSGPWIHEWRLVYGTYDKATNSWE
jgi:hypothetical protein